MLEGGPENAVVPPDRVFEAKPIWQRMVIILAGVTVNLIFAWLVFVGLAFYHGRLYDPTTELGRVDTSILPEAAQGLASVPEGERIVSIDGRTVESWGDVSRFVVSGKSDTISFVFAQHPEVRVPLHRDQLVERSYLEAALRPMHNAVIGSVIANTAAAEAGLEPGDSIVSVDGTPVRWFTDMTAIVEPAAGRALAFELIRDGVRTTVHVTPRAELAVPEDSTSARVGRIGVSDHAPIVSERYTFMGAIAAGNAATWNAAGQIVRTVRGLITRRIASNQVGGPILIGQMAGESARAGLDVLLAFMALISVNLAVVNLLPIPVLDGGAFLILAIEGIIRRPLPLKLREGIQMIGVLMVIALMILAFSNDIRRLLGFG